MGLVHQTGFLVHAEFAHHHVGNGSQFAGSEGVRQQQVDRAGQSIDPQGAARFADRNAHLLPRGNKSLHASRPGRIVRDEIAVRILRQSIRMSAHAKDLLHPRVVRSQVRQADRPVIAKAVMGLALEFIVAEPERLPRPKERTAPKQPHSHPVIRMLRVIGIRNFLFVDPGIGIELVRLKDMGQAPRLLEPAKGQGIGRLHLRVLVNIRDRARIEHQARNAFFGQNFCGHPARMARANDKNVNGFFGHYSPGKEGCSPELGVSFTVAWARRLLAHPSLDECRDRPGTKTTLRSALAALPR